LENGNPRVEPVAIVVEGIDRRDKSFGLVLAFARRELKLLRLFHEVGGCGLLAPHPHPGLGDAERDNARAAGSSRPAPKPPECAAVKFIFLGNKAGKRTTGVFYVESAAQLVGTLRHEMFAAPQALS